MVRQPVTAAAAVLYHQTSMKIRLSRCVALTVKIFPDGTSGILPCGRPVGLMGLEGRAG
jgi:hypothetical protein